MPTARGALSKIPIETEIKLAVPSSAAARKLLARHGFRPNGTRALESNQLFDTTDGRLRAAGQMLRLRWYAGRVRLTFKGPSTSGRHKQRPELEVEISAGPPAVHLFEALGFQVSFRYEKYRTLYARPRERGHVCLDETPIGVFLELEGSPSWIDRCAGLLGFSPAAYITASYGRLFRDFCVREQASTRDMLFPRRAGRSSPSAKDT